MTTCESSPIPLHACIVWQLYWGQTLQFITLTTVLLYARVFMYMTVDKHVSSEVTIYFNTTFKLLGN
jgi:hypothetical protein